MKRLNYKKNQLFEKINFYFSIKIFNIKTTNKNLNF